MATNITSQLLSSANPYKDRTSEVKPLISKWKRSGLLEGLKSETEVNSMAVLLENQAKQLSEGYLRKSLLKNSFLYSR
jgi:hypothetical protein